MNKTDFRYFETFINNKKNNLFFFCVLLLTDTVHPNDKKMYLQSQTTGRLTFSRNIIPINQVGYDKKTPS